MNPPISKRVQEQLDHLRLEGCQVVPLEELKAKIARSIETGLPLRIKQGIDPTTPHVHLGHMVPYTLMRRFQDLGHQAILVIGDMTACIGDPTGRSTERPPLTRTQAEENAQTYTRQIFTVVDESKALVRRHSEWLDAMTLPGVISMLSDFSLAQLLAHETFRKRMDAGDRLSLHELLYPLLQARDSVELQADVELGGSDQTFNILCGRDMMRTKGMEPQVAITLPLLPGTDGEKMSKSKGNHIPVLAEPFEQLRQIMKIPDSQIATYGTWLLTWSRQTLDALPGRLEREHPRDIKLELAQDIVEKLQGPEAARLARERFLREVSGNELPQDMPEVQVGPAERLDQLLRRCMGISLSEARRLLDQGGVRLDGQTVLDPSLQVGLPGGHGSGHPGRVLQVGKLRYFRLV